MVLPPLAFRKKKQSGSEQQSVSVALLIQFHPMPKILINKGTASSLNPMFGITFGHEISKLEAQKLNSMTPAELMLYWKIQTS